MYTIYRSFPRTRGDGPVLAGHASRVSSGKFPPHTRGWTLDRHPDRALRPSGFPRTRGDGPDLEVPTSVRFHDAFPPHTRGWTIVSVAAAQIRVDATFPPHTRGWTASARHGGITKSAKFPPHTRGWTRWTQTERPEANVSPAHAGMDPVAPVP